MAGFNLKIQLLLILFFTSIAYSCCQVRTTKIDNKGTVYAVLPTVEGPIYYIQKNDDVIYKSHNNFTKLKVYDGHQLIDLHVLGKGGSINGEVTLDRLENGSILIQFLEFSLVYIYNPADNKLDELSSPIGGQAIL